jgi:hypothetical protein
MPGETFTDGNVLTAAQLNLILAALQWPTPVSVTTACAAGNAYLVTTGAGALTMTLPSPATAGQKVTVKKVDSGAGTIAVSSVTNGGTILGPGCGAGLTSIPVNVLGAYVSLVSDGTNWQIVGGAQDSGWVPLSGYSNSWVSVLGPASGGTAAGYRLIGNVARLGGQIKSGSNSTTAFTLPTGVRPSYIATPTTNDGVICYWAITTGGAAKPTCSANTAVSLDGITFTVD